MDAFEMTCPRCKLRGVQSPKSSQPVSTKQTIQSAQFEESSIPDRLQQQMFSQDQFSLVSGESILTEGVSTYFKSTMNIMSCNGYLTNYRLVFCDKSPTLAAKFFLSPFSYIPPLFNKSIKMTLQIPISEIESITQGRRGKYIVKTMSGQIHNLQFPNKWESIISTFGIKITK